MTPRSLGIGIVCAVFALISGCATTVLESKTWPSYTVGKTESATIGEPFLIDQNRSVEKIKRWVGLLNSPDGWKVEDRYPQDFLRKELIYAGKSGSTIEISYREYRGGLAAPAFFQSLKYDLAESRIVSFQRFRFEILGADNQTITYTLLSN